VLSAYGPRDVTDGEPVLPTGGGQPGDCGLAESVEGGLDRIGHHPQARKGLLVARGRAGATAAGPRGTQAMLRLNWGYPAWHMRVQPPRFAAFYDGW